MPFNQKRYPVTRSVHGERATPHRRVGVREVLTMRQDT